MVIDENKCPICGHYNACGRNDPSCWCVTKEIPKSLFEQIPPQLLHKQCICLKCIDEATKNIED
ncbi:hypothetical protein KZO01_07710 [Kurthia zopfii]|uniref:cysteine-rich CWC family protein n=1 Tax=Kurthia zopfii TaxID=1650 RepID=UPI000D67A807|nr:hypothetical protein DF281_07330 [Kurthia zopfii]GEK30462.1 hypothetical protein KZO01_07710 [Kurthia zopfii]